MNQNDDIKEVKHHQNLSGNFHIVYNIRVSVTNTKFN